MKMKYQLTPSGSSSVQPSSSLDIELEELQEEELQDEECMQKEKFSDEDFSNNSEDLYAYKHLLEERALLEREVNALKLKVLALQIQTNHHEKQLNKLCHENQQKATFSRSIKRNLMLATRQSLQSQTPETFPNQLLSQIFEGFSSDDKIFKNHFKKLDNELAQIVQTACVLAYKRRKPSLQINVAEKLKGLKQKLILKYETQLAEQDKSRPINNGAIKQQCFQMFKQFLRSSCRDTSFSREYLKQLEMFYEEEISKLE
ncbi:uncharacterized protein [Drosophila kikkawai]|uniref:Uncharacterized protein n=1 Tax=Drosophila kikkawai TaxID=30033 RepID=A0ABM4GIZ4_DROKI